MIGKILAVGIALVIFCSPLAVEPVRGESSKVVGINTSVAVQSRRFGPYATLRRANEVANYARRLGYNAKIIYGGSLYYGTREYYVDVWR